MRIERLLQISLATLAIMATFLLGMGQQNSLLPALTVVAAATSVYVTDARRWFVLPRWAANVVSVSAVLYATYDFQQRDEEFGLIAIANLLIYLQFVLLFQRKLQRTYWQLAIVSLLQVVVASALNLGMEYGFVLLLYGLVATVTFALFYLHREMLLFRRMAPVLESSAQGSRSDYHPSIQIWTGGARTVSKHAHSRAEPEQSVLNRSWLLHVASFFFATLVCTVVLFFFVPRMEREAWEGDLAEQSTTGFSDSIILDDIGDILESPEVVMHVRFLTGDGKETVQYNGEPYFRGRVLSHYDISRRRSRWRSFTPRDYGASEMGLRDPISTSDTLRQHVTLRPQNFLTLFGVGPYALVSSHPKVSYHSDKLADADIHWNPVSHEITRQQPQYRGSTGRIEYTIATPRVNASGPKIIPVYADDVPRRYRNVLSNAVGGFLLDMPPEVDPIGPVAQAVLQDKGIESDQAYEVARALEQYFHQPGLFRYSLSARRSRRSSDTDAIVDFVTSRRTGHCEYFAGALTMMLRSQQIPARIVLGYRGAEYNSIGRYYIVRQLHAHAWVEAFLRPDQFPPGIEFPTDEEVLGVWLQLDPTPVAGDYEEDFAAVGFFNKLKEVRDYLQLLWTDYVLGLNSKRQREEVYGPILSFVSALFSLEAWSYFFRDFWQRLDEGLQSLLRGGWFSWQAGLSVLVVGLTSALFLRFVLIPFTRWFVRAVYQNRLGRDARKRRVDFYQSFEKLLRRHGMRRRPSQTQREFTRHASERLFGNGHVPALPHIVDAFYRVRFGGRTLPPVEEAEIERALRQLEQTLAKKESRTGRPGPLT